MHLEYDSRMAPVLKRLGLYQMSQMTKLTIDSALLTGLIERWRPETHTFHMPVGEMTVTLQDVSCLWGLPISGSAVTGVEYADYTQLIVDSLGFGDILKKRKHRKCEFRPSASTISLPLLRSRFAALPEGALPDEIERYTRAYILDMFACWMFPDASGDTVPASFLVFLTDLNNPPKVNWGAAVLACLYRGLCTACQIASKSFIGPAALLQHWSWTRFPFGRPRPRILTWQPDWGSPDSDSCPAYAARFCSKKTFVATPHGRPMGVAFFRTQWEHLTPDLVTWRPYDERAETFEEGPCRSFLYRLPGICFQERDFWRAQVPLIFYQVVEHHYPARVMRQFGLAQAVPPPAPISESEWRQLHKTKQIKYDNNWRTIHGGYVEAAENMNAHLVSGDYCFDPYDEDYRRWYQDHCAFTVFLQGMLTHDLTQPIPVPRDQRGEPHGYIPSGPPMAQMVRNYYL